MRALLGGSLSDRSQVLMCVWTWKGKIPLQDHQIWSFSAKLGLIQRFKKGINVVLEGVKSYKVRLGPSGEGPKPEQSYKPSKEGRG